MSNETIFKLGASAIGVLTIVFVVLLVKWRKDYKRDRSQLFDKKLPPVQQDPHEARYERKYGPLPKDATATEMRTALGHRTPPHTGGDA